MKKKIRGSEVDDEGCKNRDVDEEKMTQDWRKNKTNRGGLLRRRRRVIIEER